MKGKLSNRLSYLGAGIGLALFVVFGLLPGSFIGGVLGLNIAGAVFGIPIAPSILSRIVVAMGMLTGVMVTGLIFMVGGATMGWLMGTVAEVITKGEKERATEPITGERNS
ncbi:MAG: hypothetical protein GXO95_04965 [Nitrospirae bacterium]|nr:hypothetical protein [Nitrospirota bacterium]